MRRPLLLLVPLLLAPAAQAQEVFINEIHYDNAGTDQGEAIEIAGPAGTNLAGWDLVLYNGSTGEAYTTTPLGAVIPDQQNGYGTVAAEYPTNGVQNGSPDGIALVDDQGDVVQFLSYEGAFTAADGPAASLSSTDIGVEESGSTDVGLSLQLTGAGTAYADFAWTGPFDDSFGQPNAGQTFEDGGTAPAPRLVINEVDYDQPGTDDAEFFELYNGGTAAVDLDAYTVELVNGNGGAVYETISLPAATLAPGAYFVVCGDAQAVANCDLDVSPDANLIQNGSPDAIGLVLDGALVDALSYEGEVPGYTEGAGTTAADNNSDAFVSLSRFPDGADTDDNAADFTLRCGSPGALNAEDGANCPSTRPGVDPEPQIVRIHDVQGGGAESPLRGQTVTVEGVVVGDFQAGDGDRFGTDLGGFFVQEEAGDADGDPQTSEGLFVFAPDAPDVRPGDLVRVTGEVVEFNGLTELTDVTATEIVGEAGVPAPVEVRLPVDSREALERYEGMLVVFPQKLAISEYFNFDRFGEVVLALPREGRDRLYQPTSYVEPEEAAAIEEANELRKILLDDGRTSQNPDPARHPNGEVFDLDNRFRGGDVVEGATGVLGYAFGDYRIQPTEGADYASTNPRPEAPEDVGGSLRVASFNVLNYFNGDGTGGGFPTSRGADTPEELDRQTSKIVSALLGLQADVVGLIEIENDPAGEASALDDLVGALNEEAGEGTYDYIETGAIGTDAIKVALIYTPATVTPVGDPAVLDDPSFTDPNNLGEQKNRPALAQTFEEGATGGAFTAVVNHFKSKGSPCGEGDDSPVQGSCNDTRADAADALVEWLATNPTGTCDPDVLLLGDLNAYDEEDPIDEILEGADDEAGTADDYVDLVEAYEGEFAYSYVFDGEFGYLDYALANRALAGQVTGATEWHINADEPDILDYDTSFKQDAQDALYEPNPYRASDHDPVLVGLALTGPVAQAKALLRELAARVDELDLPRGWSRALEASLRAAARSLDREKLQAVRGQLGAFINKVEAQRGKKLDEPTADALIAAAQEVLCAIEGGLEAVVREADVAAEAGPGAEADVLDATPTAYALDANWPNPFNPSTEIRFALPEAADVRLVVYDVMGREVARLADGPLAAGYHRVRFDASGLASGVYLYRIEVGAFTATRRMTLVK